MNSSSPDLLYVALRVAHERRAGSVERARRRGSDVAEYDVTSARFANGEPVLIEAWSLANTLHDLGRTGELDAPDRTLYVAIPDGRYWPAEHETAAAGRVKEERHE